MPKHSKDPRKKRQAILALGLSAVTIILAVLIRLYFIHRQLADSLFMAVKPRIDAYLVLTTETISSLQLEDVLRNSKVSQVLGLISVFGLIIILLVYIYEKAVHRHGTAQVKKKHRK